MKEIRVDFSNGFIRNIAEGLDIPTDSEFITTEEWARLQGNISSCVICYYFAKMHVIAIKNALEKKLGQNGNYKRLDDIMVKAYIDQVTEEKTTTGSISITNTIIPTFRLTEENYEDYKRCVERIDSEFENHQELIQMVAEKPIVYLEEEIASRKMMNDYGNLDHHLENSKDYYHLQKVGIESYLDKRRSSIQEIGFSMKK